ncbi:extracellular solute-binding protein [Niallia sp. FSL W8-1348]|uniref:extracellular solute-binding protein n=1 Tax=Niallia sp. FSL W8-1348 TaxID=2954656 RepID=UPI0030FA68EA
MFKIRSVLLFFGICASLVGCDNTSIINKNDEVKQGDSGKVQLVVWHTYNENETKIFENEIIPIFEQKYPSIEIKPVSQSYNSQLMSALISKASANKPPDIIRMDITWVSKFADLHLLYPINQFGDFERVKDNLYPVPLQTSLYQGQYYGLPVNTNTKIAIYNKELLKKYHIEKLPETMDELMKIIEKNPVLLGMAGMNAWQSLPYFYGLGGNLLNDRNTKATGYFNSEESIQAVEKMLALYQQKKLNENTISGNYDLWDGLLSEKYIMIDEGPWFYNVNAKEQIDYIISHTVAAPFPGSKDRRSVLGGEVLSITKGTEHVEEAWEFVKWMTTEEPQKRFLMEGLLPTNKTVLKDEMVEEYPYYKAYVQSIDQSFLRPQIAEWRKIESIYTECLKQIFSGQTNIEEELTKAARKMDLVLQ